MTSQAEEGKLRRRNSKPKVEVQMHEGSISVSRAQYFHGKEVGVDTDESDTVMVPFFGTVQVGRVMVAGSITRNMGDCNSVRVEVRMELPCLPEMSEAHRACNIAAEFVESRLQQELDGAIKSRGTEVVEYGHGEQQPVVDTTISQQPSVQPASGRIRRRSA